MTRLAALDDKLLGTDSFGLSNYDKLQADIGYLVVPGADLASAATINIASGFHGVTGVTTIDNLNDVLGAIAGQQVRLWIKAGPLTIRNNGGGTGNIRTLTGLDRVVATNEIVEFAYDGAVWREQNLRASSAVLMDYTVTGAAVASIDTNTILGGNIPQTYNNLRIYQRLRGATAAATVAVDMKINNDSSALYNYITHYGNSAGFANVAGGPSQTATRIDPGLTPAGTAPAGAFSQTRMEFMDYKGTTYQKTATWQLGVSEDDAAATSIYDLVGNVRYRNAAAITRLSWAASVGNLDIGCRVIIIGEA